MGEIVHSLVAQAGGGAGGLLGMVPFIIGMFAIMYFLMIRPERKRQAEHQGFLTSLKKGDDIVLTSGIICKIHALEEKTLTVEIADKTRIKVLKQAVSGPAARYLGEAGGDKKAIADKVEEKKDEPEKKSA